MGLNEDVLLKGRLWPETAEGQDGGQDDLSGQGSAILGSAIATP